MIKSIKYNLFNRPFYKIEYIEPNKYRAYIKIGKLGGWRDILPSHMYFTQKEYAIEEIRNWLDTNINNVKPAYLNIELLNDVQ